MVNMYEQGMYGPEGFYEEAMTPATPQRGFWSFAAAIPGGPTMMSVNAGRMSRTMLYGPRSTGAGGRFGIGRKNTDFDSYTRNAIRNNNFFNPRNWGRYSTDAFLVGGAKDVDPRFMRKNARRVREIGRNLRDKPRLDIDRSVKGYQPLVLSTMGNATARFFAGKRASDEAARAAIKEKVYFERGFAGRIGAASRLNNMSARQFGKVGSQYMDSMGVGAAATGEAARTGLLMSTGGKYTGHLAGFMEGAVSARQGTMNRMRVEMLARSRTTGLPGQFMSGTEKYTDEAIRGLQTAARWSDDVAQRGTKLLSKKGASLAGKRAALAGARVGFAGAKVLAGPVGWAMLAYDMTKLTTKATYAVASTYTSAYKEATAGMTTRIGGGGFADTQASATSRARGVAAIQNSRLNARSILGNEASMMAGAF